MKRLLWVLAALCCLASVGTAGPNAGGVLVVHDAQITFSSGDLPQPPSSPPPATCELVDVEVEPSQNMSNLRVWKVYAAFPQSSSPRVKGLAWGIHGHNWTYSEVVAAGLPDPPNCFQVVEGSWPTPPGAIGQSFLYTQTATIVECYWFGGYCYQGEGFETMEHFSDGAEFVDDAVPGNVDDIAGFGWIGFGIQGQVPCGDVPGACCVPDGSCTITMMWECSGLWMGSVDCNPNPCPQPVGACCYPPFDLCIVVTHAGCDSLNGTYLGDFTGCEPAPCPVLGACCLPSGGCILLDTGACNDMEGIFHGEAVPCEEVTCLPTPSQKTTWGRLKTKYR
jgi:hypothetical protein